ncbi:MAG: hypothetical protein AAFO02_00620 [Bacteroidota bacterium]
MKLQLQLPTTWNELSLQQCLQAYAIIMSNTGRLFEAQELVPAKRLLLFKTLSGITEEQLQQWQRECLKEDPEHGHQIFLADIEGALESCNGLFDIAYDDTGEPKEYSIKFSLTNNPWPTLDRKKKNGKKKSYYAPADRDWFGNMEFLELCTTFTLFEAYIQDYEDDLLHELLATLYRPPKPRTKANRAKAYGGDRRQPYLNHEGMVAKRKKHMTTLAPQVKQLLVFWFASCRQAIIDDYPDLFTGQGGQSSKYGWGGLLMAMAGGLHQMDSVSSQPAGDALTYLDYLQEQVRLQEAAT